MKYKFVYACLLLVTFSCNKTDEPNLYKNYDQNLETLISNLGVDKTTLEITIDKSDYKLSILAKGETIKEYPVVFGTDPVGDKLMEGDRRTPEGMFKVRDHYPHKSWQKFIWIDYPTQDSWRKHKKAKSDGIIPENATIGSEIGIHGVPAGSSNIIAQKMNWTWGCISLENDDINEIYPYIFKQMTVEISQ